MLFGSRHRMIAAAGLAVVAVIILTLALWPRGPTDSDYFGPNEPTWVRVPAAFDDPVYVGVGMLNAKAGDAITLESLTLERLEGNPIVNPMLRIMGDDTQTFGGIAASALPDTLDLTAYVPLPGFRFTHEDGPVELSVRVEGKAPIHGFDGLWLRFTRNGESTLIDDWIPMRASICTGATLDSAIERCRAIADQMRDAGRDAPTDSPAPS